MNNTIFKQDLNKMTDKQIFAIYELNETKKKPMNQGFDDFMELWTKIYNESASFVLGYPTRFNYTQSIRLNTKGCRLSRKKHLLKY